MIQERAEIAECKMQDGATATGNGTVFDVGGYALANIQIQGISGDTITFEESNDGTNYHATTAKNRNGGAQGTTATADGIYEITTLAINHIRARISTYSAGTIDVLGTAIS